MPEAKIKSKFSIYLPDEQRDFINDNIEQLPFYEPGISMNLLFTKSVAELIQVKLKDKELQTALQEIESNKEEIEALEHENERLQIKNIESLKKIQQLENELQNKAPEIQEKEVIKEVEKQLAPTQVLVNFSEIQLKVVEKINENRHKKGREKQILNPEQLIKKVLFAPFFLYNHSGEFPTFLNEIPNEIKD
jgi:hypothetical protein